MARVPAIRFSEFSEEWEEKKLGDISTIIDSLHQTPKSYVENGFAMIRVTNVNNQKLILNECLNVSEEVFLEFTKKYKPKKNDIILSRVGTCGACLLLQNDEQVCLGQNTVLLNSKINSFFLYILMKSDIVQFQVNRKIVGSTQKTLSLKDLKRFDLNIPQKKEQEKIASFLSVVDKKIEKLNEKIDLQKRYKKAMMQKLFSQEIRFKDENGLDFPDWEEKKLGEISKITMGQSPDSKSYNNNEDGLYLIQGNADIKNRKSNPRNWTNEPTKQCNIGDLLLTVRAPVGAIAKSYHNACIGRGVCSIINNKLSDIEYLYQYLLWFERRWISLEQGSTFTAVSSSDIKTLKIPYPSKKEQEKIANFLSSLDTKIEVTQKEKAKAQEFKKGLLQQMFV